MRTHTSTTIKAKNEGQYGECKAGSLVEGSVAFYEIQGRRGTQEDAVAAGDVEKQFAELTNKQQEAVLKSAFAKAQQELEQSSSSGFTASLAEQAGSTAIVSIVVDKGATYEIITASLGDSTAYWYDGSTCQRLNTEFHNGDNPQEKARVENAGVPLTGDGRLNGGLAVTGAFGDKGFEQAGLTHEPFIYRTTVKKPLAKNACLILACDGLTEKAAKKSDAEYISNKIKDNAASDPLDWPKLLTEKAYADGSNDNISTLVIKPQALASLQTQPFYAAVYDGHGGSKVANYLADNFQGILNQAVLAYNPQAAVNIVADDASKGKQKVPDNILEDSDKESEKSATSEKGFGIEMDESEKHGNNNRVNDASSEFDIFLDESSPSNAAVATSDASKKESLQEEDKQSISNAISINAPVPAMNRKKIQEDNEVVIAPVDKQVPPAKYTKWKRDIRRIKKAKPLPRDTHRVEDKSAYKKLQQLDAECQKERPNLDQFKRYANNINLLDTNEIAPRENVIFVAKYAYARAYACLKDSNNQAEAIEDFLDKADTAAGVCPAAEIFAAKGAYYLKRHNITNDDADLEQAIKAYSEALNKGSITFEAKAQILSELRKIDTSEKVLNALKQKKLYVDEIHDNTAVCQRVGVGKLTLQEESEGKEVIQQDAVMCSKDIFERDMAAPWITINARQQKAALEKAAVDTFSALQDNYGQVKNQGATAIVATVIGAPDSPIQISTANAGDGSAYLIIAQPNGGFRYECLNRLHTAADKDERQAIGEEKFGQDQAANYRLGGQLEPTRLIGHQQLDNYGLRHDPEISHVKVDLKSGEKAYLVLMCDGGREKAPLQKGQDHTDYVGNYFASLMAQNVPLNDMPARFAHQAMKNGSKDNISVVVTEVQSSYGDTCQVVGVFDGNGAGGEALSANLAKEYTNIYQDKLKEAIIVEKSLAGELTSEQQSYEWTKAAKKQAKNALTHYLNYHSSKRVIAQKKDELYQSTLGQTDKDKTQAKKAKLKSLESAFQRESRGFGFFRSREETYLYKTYSDTYAAYFASNALKQMRNDFKNLYNKYNKKMDEGDKAKLEYYLTQAENKAILPQEALTKIAVLFFAKANSFDSTIDLNSEDGFYRRISSIAVKYFYSPLMQAKLGDNRDSLVKSLDIETGWQDQKNAANRILNNFNKNCAPNDEVYKLASLSEELFKVSQDIPWGRRNGSRLYNALMERIAALNGIETAGKSKHAIRSEVEHFMRDPEQKIIRQKMAEYFKASNPGVFPNQNGNTQQLSP